jgi:hypothetical protein
MKFKFENIPFCKNYCIINSYNTIGLCSPNFRIFRYVPAQKYPKHTHTERVRVDRRLYHWVVAVFLAKSVKHPFLNEISCAQNLSNPLQTVGVAR